MVRLACGPVALLIWLKCTTIIETLLVEERMRERAVTRPG